MRSPNWSRDELILALALYFRCDPSRAGQNTPEVVELSNLLRSQPGAASLSSGFRSPNSVYMKLLNFRALDPSHPSKGLDAGAKLDAEVWDEFHYDRERLAAVEKRIRACFTSELASQLAEVGEVEEEAAAPEGRLLLRLHQVRERNSTLATKKKRQVQKFTGHLACEVCGFDFQEVYGELGEGFLECHHNVPLAEATATLVTKLADLSLVCANCHRMLHRRGVLTVEELTSLLSKTL